MGVEFLYGAAVGRQTYRINDTVASLALGILSRLRGILRLGVSAVALGALAAYLRCISPGSRPRPS